RLRERVDADEARRSAGRFDRRDELGEIIAPSTEIWGSRDQRKWHVMRQPVLVRLLETDLALAHAFGALGCDVNRWRLSHAAARPLPAQRDMKSQVRSYEGLEHARRAIDRADALARDKAFDQPFSARLKLDCVERLNDEFRTTRRHLWRSASIGPRP